MTVEFTTGYAFGLRQKDIQISLQTIIHQFSV